MKILILTEKYYDKSIKYYLEDLFKCEIKTIYKYEDEIKKDYMPLIFKYKLKNYINGLKDGYDIILNLNEEEYDDYIINILNKSNYNFKYYKVTNNLFKDYKTFKKINKNIKLYKYVKNIFLIKLIKKLINKINRYITNNIGFEINDGNFKRVDKLIKEKIHYGNIIKNYFYYMKRLKSISLDKPKKIYKIGIISNNYIPIDSYYDYTIEKLMGLKNMEPTRYINSNKINKFKLKYYLYKINDYCKNNIGPNIIRNIYIIKKLINNRYDGILNIIDSNLISDTDLNIIINNICSKNNIPLVTLNYNETSTKLDIENILKVLYDSIHIKNNNK